MICAVGRLLGCAEAAGAMAQTIAMELAGLKALPRRQRRFLYFIWREPYMVVSQATYISRMLETIGLTNACTSENRYPSMTIEDARRLAPDLVLLSTEPYPFRERDAVRLAAAWDGHPELLKIDGQLMSWYGAMTIPGLRALRDWSTGQPTALVSPFPELDSRG